MSLATTVFFQAASGRSPVREFIESLGKDDSIAIASTIATFALEFPTVITVKIKHLQGKLWEMKVGGFRVLYGVVPDTLLIAHVFAKKTQKTPKQDLELGAKRLKTMMEERQ